MQDVVCLQQVSQYDLDHLADVGPVEIQGDVAWLGLYFRRRDLVDENPRPLLHGLLGTWTCPALQRDSPGYTRHEGLRRGFPADEVPLGLTDLQCRVPL